MYSCKRSLVVVAAVAHLCGAAGTMQLPWTTNLNKDFPAGSFGLDGLWQAVAVFVGDDDSNSQNYSVPLALWPGADDTSYIPTVEASGNYSVNDSGTASKRASPKGRIIYDINFFSKAYFDLITFLEKAALRVWSLPGGVAFSLGGTC